MRHLQALQGGGGHASPSLPPLSQAAGVPLSLSAADYKVLAQVLVQCQSLLTAGSRVLQLAKEEARAALHNSRRGIPSAVTSPDMFARVKAAIVYACGRCDSYAAMREVIVRQIGSKAWEAHHAFIASEIRANISAQLSSFRATGTPSDVPHTGTANKSRPVTSHHRTEPTINQSQARNTWQSRSTPAVLNSTSLALASSQTASRSVPSFSKAEGQSGKSRIRSASAHVTQSHASPSKSPGPTVSSASAANPPASGCRRFTTGSGSGDTPRRHLFSSADDSTANDSSSPSIEHEALPPAQHSRIWAWGGSLLSGRTVRHVAPDNFGSIESASAVDIEGTNFLIEKACFGAPAVPPRDYPSSKALCIAWWTCELSVRTASSVEL